MLIEIISFIIIVVVIFIFAKLNYKKCEKEGEKIIIHILCNNNLYSNNFILFRFMEYSI